MQGYELVKQIEAQKTAQPDRVFIKWWRKEEDFIDFDLVPHFLETLNYSSDIGGFELIGMDEMWETVERRTEGRARREQRGGNWVIHWTPPKGAEDVEYAASYPYTPESLLKILDAETDYNFVD